MQDIHSVCKPGHIYDSPLTPIMNANFHRASTNRVHWLPISWQQALLHIVKLETRSPANICRKVLQVILTGTNELKVLHEPIYIFG
jgi:hypothetical protein